MTNTMIGGIAADRLIGDRRFAAEVSQLSVEAQRVEGIEIEPMPLGRLVEIILRPL